MKPREVQRRSCVPEEVDWNCFKDMYRCKLTSNGKTFLANVVEQQLCYFNGSQCGS